LFTRAHNAQLAEVARFTSSGNLGLGVTPSTGGHGVAFQFAHVGNGGGLTAQAISANNYPVNLTAGAISSGSSTWKYTNADASSASRYQQVAGTHAWFTAPSGTAGDPITFTQAMSLDASGNLGVGTTSPQGKLDVSSSSAGVTAGDLVVDTANKIVYVGRLSSTSGDASTFIVRGRQGTEAFKVDAGSPAVYSTPIYASTVGGTNRDVYVDDTGLLGYVSSIRESKTNIQNIADTSWLLQLNPVSFNYRKKDAEGNYTDKADGQVEYGLLAEETETVKQEICFYDRVDGKLELRGISYSKLITPMLKLLQEQQAIINDLKARLDAANL
jgi:hypothetical protein